MFKHKMDTYSLHHCLQYAYTPASTAGFSSLLQFWKLRPAIIAKLLSHLFMWSVIVNSF